MAKPGSAQRPEGLAPLGLWDGDVGGPPPPGAPREGEPNGLGGPAAQGDSPVGAPLRAGPEPVPSRAGHVKPGPKRGGPPSKPEHSPVTDSGQVPRGKGEKHPGRGVKQHLKPCAHEQSEQPCAVTACLL